ncbi:MAG: hypothetical protein JW847_07590 [Candidatus Omnitrophica bacterium]|nr:hypothetical protein [Candidatus Omnitrophota bacterium]
MFSNDSRWDRHTPEQSRHEEPVDVAVIFKEGKVFPQSFFHKGRKYPVKEVTYHWAEARGAEVLHYYSVTDGANLYKIYFNTKHLYWRLAGSCPLE